MTVASFVLGFPNVPLEHPGSLTCHLSAETWRVQWMAAMMPCACVRVCVFVLSILVSGGKETNQDSLSNGE